MVMINNGGRSFAGCRQDGNLLVGTIQSSWSFWIIFSKFPLKSSQTFFVQTGRKIAHFPYVELKVYISCPWYKCILYNQKPQRRAPQKRTPQFPYGNIESNWKSAAFDLIDGELHNWIGGKGFNSCSLERKWIYNHKIHKEKKYLYRFLLSPWLQPNLIHRSLWSGLKSPTTNQAYP